MAFDDSANALLDAYEENRSEIISRIGQQKYDENLIELKRLN